MENALCDLLGQDGGETLPKQRKRYDPNSNEFLRHLEGIASRDASGLIRAHGHYGNSWKKRGGVSAFMMICRKWDRLEKFCEEHGYNIFDAMAEDDRGEGIIDDIRDLRRYLLLIEAEAAAQGIACASAGHRDNLIETAEAAERKKVGGPGTRLDSGEVHQYDRELDHLSPPPGPSRR